jgi:hypothetical protein
MKIRIKENAEDSSNLGNSKGQLDILVTPKDGSTVEDINNALNTKDYYGSYLINTRDKREVEKAVVTHFGPSHPLAKKKAQAERGGEPFPMKTKEAMDNLIKGLGGDKPGILTWEIRPNGTILFPSLKNFSQLGTINILKQVLGAAGIKYKSEKFEDTSKYLSEQVSRMQQLAGINEIKVNNPTQKWDDEIGEMIDIFSSGNDNEYLPGHQMDEEYEFELGEGDSLENLYQYLKQKGKTNILYKNKLPVELIANSELEVEGLGNIGLKYIEPEKWEWR